MKQIPLTKGKVAVVDDEDYEWLSKISWHYTEYGYAKCGGKLRSYMHRLILKTPEGYQVDHINGNKLDNRRENLRSVTISQNAMNRKTRKDSATGYKGVMYEKEREQYGVRIKVNDKYLRIGRFTKLEDAVKAYNEAALKYYGEFARLNRLG